LPFLFEFGAIVEATTKNLTQSVVDLRLHNQRYEEHGVGTVTEVEMPGKIVHFGPPQIMELKFGKASSEKKPPITTAINNSSAVALVDSEKLERPKFRKYTKHSSKQRLRAVSSKNTTTASTPLATSTTPTEGQAEQNQTAVDGGQSKVPTFGTSMQLLPKQQPSTESPSGGDSNVDQKEPSATTTTETPPPHPLPIPSGTGSNRKTVHSPTHHNVEAVHEHETVTHEQSSLFQSSGPPAPAPESSFPSSLVGLSFLNSI
jgi:hypothetical protein